MLDLGDYDLAYISQQLIAPIRRGAHPGDYPSGVGEDIAHVGNLRGLFDRILLIDTQRVDPDFRIG